MANGRETTNPKERNQAAKNNPQLERKRLIGLASQLGAVHSRTGWSFSAWSALVLQGRAVQLGLERDDRLDRLIGNAADG